MSWFDAFEDISDALDAELSVDVEFQPSEKARPNYRATGTGETFLICAVFDDPKHTDREPGAADAVSRRPMLSFHRDEAPMRPKRGDIFTICDTGQCFVAHKVERDGPDRICVHLNALGAEK